MQKLKKNIALDQSIIKTLIYFDIFNYPLKANEVYRFLGRNSVTEQDVIQSLNTLADENHLVRFGEFYLLEANQMNVARRIKGNTEAQRSLPVAKVMAERIARFPFVRSVMASGSLSKEYMDEESDFDFFIITAPNRLWICRTLMAIYKRVFLKNSHKFFCTNYFIDTKHLEIDEKNLFTATELATVIPLYGKEYYYELQNANQSWLLKFLPNFRLRNAEDILSANMSHTKRIAEKTIDILFGSKIEKFCMRLMLSRWKKLYERKYDATDFNVAFKTTASVSKSHPRNFQRKVMELYEQKIEKFSQTFNLK